MGKKRQYGPVAQLGERQVRNLEVEGSIPFGSTISRKITAKLAVIFRLTTIIPQTGTNLTTLSNYENSEDKECQDPFVLFSSGIRAFLSAFCIMLEEVRWTEPYLSHYKIAQNQDGQ